MILQSLVNYYEALADRGELERPGWQSAKVSFGLRISEDGTLLDVIDLRQSIDAGNKKKLAPVNMSVPMQEKRSSGIKANFLCENVTYFLGVDDKGKPQRAQSCFDACAKLHHELLDEVEHPAAKAVLNFFDRWKPEYAKTHEVLAALLKEMYSANLVFMVRMEYAQEVPEIRKAWQKHYDHVSDEAQTMRCLVTGKQAAIARLHPNIKNVLGAQSSGASLVSFNAPAFESYGRDKEQGLNAPVSEYAAFAYGTVLNRLAADKEHMQRLGDTTVVYWAEDAEPAYADFMSAMLGGGAQVTNQDMKQIMCQLANGQNASWNEVPLNPENRFYVLGLAPNAARLSVRFFLQDSFGASAKHMAQHHERMEIVSPAFDQRKTLSIWQMLSETVNPNSRDKSASPQLAGDVLRAVLTGGRYPTTLYDQVQMRIRAEHDVSRGKAAIIKAYLLRNAENGTIKEKSGEVLDVKLSEETTYAPYVLGRLFAVLEGLQGAANPGINTTIKDRYFTSACCTPAMVFPVLLRLAQAHLKKLNEAGDVYFSKQITQLIGMLDEAYPKRLNLYDQGIFQLGYYHQTQKRFEKKEDKNNG